MEELQVICPHCDGLIIIEALNCCVFRHGIYKSGGIQIHPHLDKQMCDKLVENDLIYGCGKPFEIVITETKYICVVCDYK
jgi:DNA-directed RNA polymerase subunit RPC12/RpoP